MNGKSQYISQFVRRFVAVDVVVPHPEHDAAVAGDGGREGHLVVAAPAKVRQEPRLARPQLRQPQVALVPDAENPIDSAATKLSIFCDYAKWPEFLVNKKGGA